MIRNSLKSKRITIVPGIHITDNPFAQTPGTARIMRNIYVENGTMRKLLFMPKFGVTDTTTNTGDFTDIVNFRYYRAGAPENKVLGITKAGAIWDRNSSWMQKVFPLGSQSSLSNRPFFGTLSNRFFCSDNSQSIVFDGRLPFRTWGITRSTTAPTVSAIAAGSLTMATGLKAAISWVILDENGNRVHESSRSNISAFQVLAGENLRVDITALSIPSHATHWSAYVSELDGSNVLKRVATTAVTTLTVDVSALPAATNAKAPIRNDPPPKSSVGAIAKNRIFIRDDAAPNTYYFCALGEVQGLANGSPSECFPGYGANSISDISNSDFISDREIRAFVEHENIVFIFSESKGYALIGELNLLDNRSPRSLVKLQQFPEGCIGPQMCCSTPYGLVWMSPSKRVWLWKNGNEIVDLGFNIQRILNTQYNTYTAQSSSFNHGNMKWYSANGKQWLIVTSTATMLDDIAGDTVTSTPDFKTFIFDFGTAVEGELGSWYEWDSSGAGAAATDPGYSCVGQFQDNDGNVFLLGGDATGNCIRQLDSVCAPTHLNHSCILGSTYLGSSVQNGPPSYLRTGVLEVNAGSWGTASFIEINQQYISVKTASTVYGLISATAPAATFSTWIDVEDPDQAGSSITTSPDTAMTSNDKRAWFVPQSAGNTNIGGAFCRHAIVQIQFPTATEDIDSNGTRLTPLIYEINKLAVVLTPQKEMSE